ncbi:unnamed protein product [Ranitomeya imitator]|uniref:Uncharacterized protein n=1 Tax=Ranitomeya imitator TaxID=111125 RepID=A0ABN9KY31_9NEOB|nr:unnamed protein product [Ranitomeya imitator]
MTLLTVNPEHRCSCLLDIQTSAYLSDIVWEDVLEKKVEPVFSSLQKGRLHCDPTFELEEMILESRPLHKKKKRLAKNKSRDNSRDNSQSDDYLQECLDALQQEFVIFNREKLKKAPDMATRLGQLSTDEAEAPLDADAENEAENSALSMCVSVCSSTGSIN